MANNSLNKERSNQDKLLQMEKQAAEARKKRIVILSVIAAIILAIAAYVVCIILFESARPWMIAITIGIVYAVLWNLLRYNTDFDYVPWYMFTNICLAVACIPLYCVSTTTRAYAFGFALGILASAIGLLGMAWQDVSVERKQDRYSYRTRYINTYTFKHNGREYFTTYFSALFGGVLFSIALGLIFTGVARSLIIGCGVALSFIVMAYMATALYYDSDMSVSFVVFYSLMGATGIAFCIASYYLTIVAICLFAAVVLSSVIIAILRDESEWFWGVGGGVALAGIAVLVLLFAHVPVTDGFVIENGVLLSYGGTEEIVVIPEEVTEIGAKAFAHRGPRKNMKEVVIHYGITTIGDKAFKNCDALIDVTIRDSVKVIGEYAFDECDSIKNIEIPGSVEKIDSYAFAYCSGLENITFGEGVKVIGMDAFAYCSALTSVTLPDSLTTLGSYSFSSCGKLTEIYMGKNIANIGGRVFENGASKITIYYAGTEDEWNNIEKSKTPKWNGGSKPDIKYMFESITIFD